MQSLESELETARALKVDTLADAIESIGFECTRCGACCTGEAEDDHTATVFPDEVRELQESTERDWRDVARPMPYGLADGEDGPEGETFEWALQTDSCGDCAFYEEDDDGVGACVAHDDRPLICRTYPFSVALDGTSQPMGAVVDSVALGAQREAGETGETGDEEGVVRAHECEGLGRDISRSDAEDLAAALKERAVRELEEAIGVRDAYEPTAVASGEVVVHDSEGAKRPDGTPVDD
ncbi:uncharacterized protein Nmag_2772 [Natrialba magadii ATCC 43099]|uniref:YkgJ family cysteine cluster protein n=1 Tax=Natrialba magadii (strain ATCC 43099 / DSM 3394 / CCM 3739 / CIP 104546 / IAM 13178 / JCM 8861 / NBRC 102185 / NCIMB 2190 / MS3) TaxID=547559 RepID=D3SZR7_NATMM|nr:YkgJ family cysteine cluster protein [Natrialba magadii]ADD06327.1 uncharacterized protein Nmag_2772 [Natrialba magadii ATCC 43099]ELY31238.1 hypothetical protein C500_06541 [Natrialba magadii ATCC 43099]